MPFAIDIETIPDLSMVDLLPQIQPDKRIKDLDKVIQDVVLKKQAQIQKMGLNPIFAKVICICLYSPEKQYVLMGEEEEILKKFWETIGRHTQIFTYNGRNFDFPVIIKRSLRYNIGNFYFNTTMFCDRYKSARHVDVMESFCGYGNYEKLDTLSKVYLGDEKDEISFLDFPKLLETKEGQETIAKYCMQDAKLTWQLAEKMGFLME